MKRIKSPWSAVGLSVTFAGSATSAVVALFALRNNNRQMVVLYDAVTAADTSGVAVQESVVALQTFVTSHMNTNPPKLGSAPAVQLKSSYERAKNAETARVSAERTRISQEATAYCEANVRNVQLSVRAECVAQYTADRPVTERQIVTDLYRYDFVSPRWSPDLAGWSIVMAYALGIAFILQAVSRLVATMIIKR